MTGSELRQLCEEARRNAILDGASAIGDNDFLLRLARLRIPRFEAQSLSAKLIATRALSPKLFTVRRMSELFNVSTGKISMLLKTRGANDRREQVTAEARDVDKLRRVPTDTRRQPANHLRASHTQGEE